MTPEQLAAIKERADRATEGPWDFRHFDEDDVSHIFSVAPQYMTDGESSLDVAYSDTNGDNAAFIAHSRQDIPDLLAEVERLKEENEAQANTLAMWQQTQNEYVEGRAALYSQWQRVEHEIKMLKERMGKL